MAYWLLAALSLTGVILNIYKIRACFALWAFTNAACYENLWRNWKGEMTNDRSTIIQLCFSPDCLNDGGLWE